MFSVDATVALATLLFAVMTFSLGHVSLFWILCGILFAAGVAWISILVVLNVTAQTMSPDWVRARSLSIYLLVLQGGMAAGSALWGAVAARMGVSAALLGAALGMIAGLATIRRYPLRGAMLRADAHDEQLAAAPESPTVLPS